MIDRHGAVERVEEGGDRVRIRATGGVPGLGDAQRHRPTLRGMLLRDRVVGRRHGIGQDELLEPVAGNVRDETVHSLYHPKRMLGRRWAPAHSQYLTVIVPRPRAFVPLADHAHA
jgi:hypothetical protein